jgi:hypothetical protein
MNSPKEPEPGPGLYAAHSVMGHKAGRILRTAPREGEGYVPGVEVEEFIGG